LAHEASCQYLQAKHNHQAFVDVWNSPACALRLDLLPSSLHVQIDGMLHVPKNQADDVNMDDDDDVDEEVELLPTLEVIVRPQEKSKKEDDVSSQQRGETSQQAGHSEQRGITELDVASGHSPEERHGIYVVRQLSPKYQELLRDISFNSQNILTGEDREGRPPMRRDQVGFFGMVLLMEYMFAESHGSFMDTFAPSTQF
jgi:ABC-type Na+ efflux pump permease subunit